MVLTPFTFAEDLSYFSTLSARDGLPNVAVSSIVQDQLGFLWFGTQGGLVRYDGYEYKTYVNAPFEKDVLSHDQVQTLFVESTTLWVGTYGGLNKLDLMTDHFTHFKHDPDTDASLANDLIIAIERDALGRLWVGTSKGLDLFDEKTLSFKHYLPGLLIRDIHLDKTGTLWVAISGGGIAVYNETEDAFERIRSKKGDPSSLPNDLVMSISEGDEGTLWFGTWAGGLSRLIDRENYDFKTTFFEDDRIYFVNAQDPNHIFVGTWGGGLFDLELSSGEIRRYKAGTGPGSLPNDVLYSSLLDSNGVFWFGTNGGGLARTEKRVERYEVMIHDPDNKNSLSPGKVSSILQDPEGFLWVGVYNGGLNRYNPLTRTFKHYRHDAKNPRSLGDDIVNYLFVDSEKKLWVSTNNGLCLYNPKTDDFTVFLHDDQDSSSIADSVVYVMEEAPDGDFWIGTYTQGLDRYEKATGRFIHYPPDLNNPLSPSGSLVYSLEYDAEGNLWIGYNNGLDRMNKDGSFTRYHYDLDDTDGLSSNTVRTIFRDSKGQLWYGTVGGGLMRYDAVSDRFIHFTKKEGLPNNTVRSILESDTGAIWIGTASGLGVISVDGNYFRGYSVFNELKDRDFHIGAWKANDGTLYFGGSNSVYRLLPSEKGQSSHVPRLLISNLHIGGASSDTVEAASLGSAYRRSLSLDYKDNYFSISFATVDFRDPKRNQYSYKLEGFDTEWSPVSANNTATYTNLPGGKFVFRVRASDNDGYWNDEALSFPLTVASPPWLGAPAFILYFLVLAGFGYLVASLRGKNSLRSKITELTIVKASLEEANQRLADLSMMDGLTGIPNRRRLKEFLPSLIANSAREKAPLSMLMLDLDFFKGYNDKYGHLAGDEALKAVARVIENSIERATDLAARFGGEEFIVVLPNTDTEGARIVAERIRKGVEALAIPNMSSTVSPLVTISAGLASAILESEQNGDELIARADSALYAAKSKGRNRTEIAVL